MATPLKISLKLKAEPEHKKPDVNPALKTRLYSLLTVTKSKDNFGYFLKPVDPRLVPDYPLVVKRPMDFSTVEKKLGSYASLSEFKQDVTLIFHNAMLYNASSTPYYKEAESLLDFFTQLIEKEEGLAVENEKPKPKKDSADVVQATSTPKHSTVGRPRGSSKIKKVWKPSYATAGPFIVGPLFETASLLDDQQYLNMYFSFGDERFRAYTQSLLAFSESTKNSEIIQKTRDLIASLTGGDYNEAISLLQKDAVSATDIQ